jgi:hypothetical protein
LKSAVMAELRHFFLRFRLGKVVSGSLCSEEPTLLIINRSGAQA